MTYALAYGLVLGGIAQIAASSLTPDVRRMGRFVSSLFCGEI